jgi:16S rRNA (cytosine967-C5)-methyltransferase
VSVSPARRAAFGALLRIAQTGAYADEMINGPLFFDLSSQDRGLATEIVLGTLRHRGVLDALLSRSISRPLAKLDTEVLTALRLGAYQMRYLDRIPDRAAVSESVELIKHSPKRSAAGLVNAALRKLPERQTPEFEIEQALPVWLRERWQRVYGLHGARQMATASSSHPATYLRLSVEVDEQQLLERLDSEGLTTEATELPTARKLISGRVEQTACWREGLVRVQDLGAQYIVPLLELEPQHRLLDLCAAPGGKSAHAASVRGSAAGIVACDVYVHRLRTMRHLVSDTFDLVALDAEHGLPFRPLFDRVLVDVPCSGTGTLARNPDLTWKLQPEDLTALVARQRRILSTALGALAPSGIAVYATCSVEPEENIEVVEAVLSETPGWKIGQRLDRLPGRDAGDGFFAVQIVAS